MAVESFTELLHKLKEVHEHEVEGWQEKVVELSNKKNCDAKRLEELYSRNQSLREQHKMLTENIKQLENMLRAGLCDRCTVTQEMAKKRQQDYESSHLQSLQHISLLTSEISVLMKENDRLREEVKNLRGRIERQNGHSEEAGTPEFKRSPDPVAASLTLMTSALKQDQQPSGGAIVKNESEHSPTPDALRERQTPEKRAENKLQGYSGTHHFESSKPITLFASTVNPVSWRERRAASLDSAELRSSPHSPHPRQLKNNLYFSSAPSEERHAPASVPLRPHPIKTTPSSLPWPLPERSDWVTMVTGSSTGANRSVVVHPKPSQTPSTAILRFPNLVPSTAGHGSHPQMEGSGLIRNWPERTTCPPQRSLSDQAEGRERISTVIAPPTRHPLVSSYKNTARQERIFGENLREGEVEAPLDLSSAGGMKEKETETAQNQYQSDTAPLSSSSTSSPAAPQSSPSSSHCASSPPSDQQGGDVKPQTEETQERQMEEKEEEEKEKQGSAELSENRKVPTVTISLRPVVVLEALKTAEQEQKIERRSPKEKEEDEDERQATAKRRAGESSDALPPHLKEKRLKTTALSHGSHHEDSEQG